MTLLERIEELILVHRVPSSRLKALIDVDNGRDEATCVRICELLVKAGDDEVAFDPPDRGVLGEWATRSWETYQSGRAVAKWILDTEKSRDTPAPDIKHPWGTTLR